MIKGRQLFIMVGPSGAGKNTLVVRMVDLLSNIIQMSTATTRPRRPYEVNGREHHFYTEEEFNNLLDNGEFAEWQVVHNNLYGTMKSVLEKGFASDIDYIADVEVLGAFTLKELYPDNVVLVFVMPSSLDVLEQRIRGRGAVTEQEVKIRLSRVDLEMSYMEKCDYLVINDDLHVAVEQLKGIILAERSRRELINFRTKRGFEYHKYHLAATALVFNSEYSKILLVKRRKGITQGWWYPPGGHVEIGEYPHDAVLREAKEETGYEIEILPTHKYINTVFGSTRIVPQPYWILEEKLENHSHYDFIYLCKVKRQAPGNETPDSEFRWFSVSDIQNMQTPQDVKFVVKKLFHLEE